LCWGREEGLQREGKGKNSNSRRRRETIRPQKTMKRMDGKG